MTSTKANGAKTRKRKPHNAPSLEYASFNELLEQVAAQPRNAVVNGNTVQMPRSERLLRLMLDRALQGKVRGITKLLQLMAANQRVAATHRDEFVTVINVIACNL